MEPRIGDLLPACPRALHRHGILAATRVHVTTGPLLRLARLGGVENGAQIPSHLRPQGDARHVGLCVLLQVKLTPPPRRIREEGASRGSQARVIVARDELRHLEPALAKPFEKRAPVRARV